MPLVKRSITPVSLCRDKVPDKCPNDLEAVAVNALAGLILQLGSLAKHADELFGELLTESTNMVDRAKKAAARTATVKAKLDTMDGRKGGEGCFLFIEFCCTWFIIHHHSPSVHHPRH